MNYRIKNGDGDYWSNELGWTDKSESDLFTHEEKNTLNLPIGGSWVQE